MPLNYVVFRLKFFSHLGGASHRVGQQLVLHPQLKAVGFTGSFIGGKSLYDLVQSREEPIPVFAEMGSINPIFITEKRLATDEKTSGKFGAIYLLRHRSVFAQTQG